MTQNERDPTHKLPVAVCTDCNQVTRSAALINKRCTRGRGRTRCKGVFRSDMPVGDWKECEYCGGDGCVRCGDVGYILIGHHRVAI